MFALDMSVAFFGTSVIRRLPLVSSEVRQLDPTDIVHQSSTLQLATATVTTLADEIVSAHTQALLARRQRLVLTVDALLRHVGAHVDATDPSGQVLARSNSGKGTAKSYSIRVSPRPAELGDFHLSHSRAGGAKPVVAAPASWERGTVREAMDWLETTSGIPLVEEGDWLRAARDVKGGVL
jgi:hypothetical protein